MAHNLQVIVLILQPSGVHQPKTQRKSLALQIIASGGDESVSIGTYMLDTYIFRLENIAMGIFRPNDLLWTGSFWS